MNNASCEQNQNREKTTAMYDKGEKTEVPATENHDKNCILSSSSDQFEFFSQAVSATGSGSLLAFVGISPVLLKRSTIVAREMVGKSSAKGDDADAAAGECAVPTGDGCVAKIGTDREAGMRGGGRPAPGGSANGGGGGRGGV